VKAHRALLWRTVVAFHEEIGLLPTIVAKSVFTNKISAALESNRPYQGKVFRLGLPAGKKVA